ncbi:Ff.00g039050.m01.CDS01 [Fusarium sp. VM40]|nr:Ff.00g039050.m01.CDS01 [Fusarium sp. VM40]
MTNNTLEEADLFEKGNHYYLDNAKVLVYGLNDATTLAVQHVCDNATESYASKILNWPNGRLEKPHVCRVDAQDGKLQNVDDCKHRFVNQFRELFQSSPPYDLPLYPHAFVVVDMEKVQSNETVTLAVVYESDEQWKIRHCPVPIQVELGLTVESLRMGDITEEDVPNQFSDLHNDSN